MSSYFKKVGSRTPVPPKITSVVVAEAYECVYTYACKTRLIRIDSHIPMARRIALRMVTIGRIEAMWGKIKRTRRSEAQRAEARDPKSREREWDSRGEGSEPTSPKVSGGAL